eukprot:2932904-Rhodomonas_salina.1
MGAGLLTVAVAADNLFESPHKGLSPSHGRLIREGVLSPGSSSKNRTDILTAARDLRLLARPSPPSSSLSPSAFPASTRSCSVSSFPFSSPPSSTPRRRLIIMLSRGPLLDVSRISSPLASPPVQDSALSHSTGSHGGGGGGGGGEEWLLDGSTPAQRGGGRGKGGGGGGRGTGGPP